jgi:hypothetical protein
MRHPWRSFCSAGACALSLLGSACSTPTTETAVWQNPTYAATAPMRNVAVFAGHVNETERRTLEDSFVLALAAYGVRATPSYSVFPQGQVPGDQAAIRAALQQRGYDGALVSTMRGVTDQVNIQPSSGWAGGFYGAFWGPGSYAYTDRFVKFETTLWNPQSGNMVWSAITQTENPTSGHDFATSLTGTVVPSLSQRGLIPPKQGTPVSLVR